MRISDWSSDVCSSDLLSWVTGEGRAGSSPTANMGGGVDDRYGVRGKVFDAINKAEYLGSPALVANTPGDCAVDDGARSWLKDQVAGDCAMQDQLAIGRASGRERGCTYV